MKENKLTKLLFMSKKKARKNNNMRNMKLGKVTHNSDERHQQSTRTTKALVENLKRNLNEEELDTKLEGELKKLADDAKDFPILSGWGRGVLKETIRSMVKKGYNNNPEMVGCAMTMLEMDLQHERAANK